MKHFFVFLLSICCMTAVAQPSDSHYTVRHYNADDGLSQNTVVTMLQDHEGFLWLGTWNGLNKFDGYEFTVYKSLSDGSPLLSSRMEYLYEDRAGRIWFQTYDTRLYCLDKGTEQLTCICDAPLQPLSRQSTHLTETADGTFWAAMPHGILRLQPDEEGFIKEITPTEFTPCFVTKDTEERVWFCTDEGLVRAQADGSREVMISLPQLAERTVTTAYAGSRAVWFGTDNGQLLRYSLHEKSFEHVDLGTETVVTCLCPASSSEMAITTRNGIFLYDKHDGRLRHLSSATHPEIQNNNFLSVTADSYGILWFENEQDGIFRYRPQDGSLRHLEPERDPRYVRQAGPNLIILEDSRRELWLNPRGGGFSRYDRENDCLQSSYKELSNIVHSAYADRNGSLWLCTYDKGLDRVDIEPQQFMLYDLRRKPTETGEVRAMLELRSGEILTADKDGRVLLSDLLSGRRQQLPIASMVYSLFEAEDGDLWLGTRYEGLLRMRRSGNNYRQVEHYHADGMEGCISSDAVYDIAQTADGRLIAATYGGGVNILDGDRFIHAGTGLQNYPQGAMKVRALLLEGDSVVWAATTSGVVRISLSDYRCLLLPSYDIRCLLQDHEGVIRAGSFGGGLLSITDDNRLLPDSVCTGSDIILAMAEDEAGRLWVAGESELIRYDRGARSAQHFTPLEGRSNAYFGESRMVRLHSGELIAGYSNGYCRFDPGRILRSDEVPPLEFTRLQLFNSDVHPADDDSPLKKSISQTTELTLRHDQSVFSIEYAALDFTGAERIEYAFLLEGFEKEWNYVGRQRKATYTNLPAGTYHFHVRSTNGEGVWVDNTSSLTIHVRPSFWRTGWAFILYILLALALLYAAWVVFRRYTTLQQQIEVEQQVNDIKLRFFTNISHELRTPLTLVSGPVDNILQTERIPQSVRTQLEIVQSNARRMLRLINEILDFRKIQNKKMRLKVQPSKLAKLISDTCNNFQKEAYDKSIRFNIENNAPDTEVWVDREKFDMILFNLLSNAFKFTPAGKSITVRVQEKADFVLMQVQDEGVGIPKEKRGLLFERFSSHNEIDKAQAKAGTGIGLNLVKELVDLHHGYIEVESEPGSGTTFTVMLRTGKDHFGNDVDYLLTEELTTDENVPTVHLDDVKVRDKQRTMLIVEDNDDMRAFLTSIFQTDFNIANAHDGTEGISEAMHIVPDIIITDLMMPNMDGLEMTGQLKEDEHTSHIPVILLTAKAAIESRLEAMRYGADDYLTKPFSAEYLRARVDNILQQRERLQQSYRKDLLRLKPQNKQQATPNEAFLAKLMDFMERNMDNNEMLVEDMVSEMALGRTVFFNKLKSLTGLSPVEFIREVRIKRAAQLLEQGTYNVTEITYMVGMNDSRYFSKCFKSVYGMTPTEYKRSVGK
ncbi:MAG: response regulator [Paludibacteraceae bacterium]|nr:response regulator [Paludibacteraceae bacterium]